MQETPHKYGLFFYFIFIRAIHFWKLRFKKGKVLVFHWRGGYLTKEVLNELLDLIRKAGMEKEKNAMVSINWPQAVLRVQYADIQVQESVMLEEANEGEKD